MKRIEDTGQLLLDEVYGLIGKQNVLPGLDRLSFGLWKLRKEYPAEKWSRFCQTVCRRHLLKDVIYQSPLANRAYYKPRGYAGDAMMMDYIYGHITVSNEAGEQTRAIYQWETQTPSARSVCERRNILSAYVDSIAATCDHRIKILSLACGHLREAQQSEAVQNGMIGEYVGLDNDQKSLAVIRKEQANGVIKTVYASVMSLLKKKLTFAGFDLVYASGLYDYLGQPAARALTRIMFEMVDPGGKVLIANFAPNLTDIGYMEAFLDWRLIYRDEYEIEALAKDIPEEQIASSRIFRDSYKNLVFLELTRG